MLRIGIVGIGFMGMIHYLAYQQTRGVKVVALASRDPKKRAGDWRGIQGNFGPPGEQMDLKGVAAYENFADLLADPTVDVVDICLPPHAHADAAVAALAAGKHVFCEKPLALTTAECRRMVAAADKHGRQLAVGHVLPFFPEYAHVVQAAADGRYGKLLGGQFKRIISDPRWLPDFYDPAKVGGPLVDLHVHDAHLIRYLFGQPTSLVSQGRMRGEVVEFCTTQFTFADPELAVSAVSGVIRQQGRSFTHAFELHFERATLLYDFAVIGGEGRLLMPLTVLDDKGKARPAKLAAGGELAAFVGEIKELARAIDSGRPSALLGADLARDAIALCHKQTESVRKGRPVKV